MSTGSTVAISDTSRAILELEGEVSNFDADIRAKVAELLKVQQELSRMVTHRDALIATIKQISDYRHERI
jgi:hypothetical protein